MKKLFTLILVAIACQAFAQKDSLKVYNDERVRITSNGMEILGGWGLVNAGISGPTWVNSTSPETRYFFQMNTIWGATDFLAGLFSYTGLQNSKNKPLSAAETLRQQQKIEKIFFINGCLDVVYIGTGAYLKLAGDSRNSPIMKGYGGSILLQGGFLLIFDGLMYKAEKDHGDKLRHFFEKHPITFDGRRVGIIFNM
jgi:hypothetical protein